MYSFYFLTSRSERCFQSLSTHNVVGKYWSVLLTYSYNIFSLPKTKQMIRSLKYTWIFLWHYASVTFKCRVWTPPKAAATPDLQKKHRGHDPSAAAGFSPAYWTSIRTVCFIKRVKKKNTSSPVCMHYDEDKFRIPRRTEIDDIVIQSVYRGNLTLLLICDDSPPI